MKIQFLAAEIFNSILAFTPFSLKKWGSPFLQVGSFLKLDTKNITRAITTSKHYGFAKNCLFVFFLYVTLITGVLIKDYVNDKIKIENAYQDLKNSLISYGETHTQFFYHLKDKILSETAYNDKEKLQHLFTSLDKLRAYTTQPYLKQLTGLRWITADLRAIGSYGHVRNFNPKDFVSFLRFLEQLPGTVQMATISNQPYLGMGIMGEKELRGYLLLPTSLDALYNRLHPTKTILLQSSPQVDLSSTNVVLEELIKTPSSFLKITTKIKWFSYFSQNVIAYVSFLLLALALLFLKRNNETKKENELFAAKKKIHSLSESHLTQQKAANLILTRLHDGVASINQISKLLLETKSQPQSNVFSEKEQINFVKKIYETSLALEDPIINKKACDLVEIPEIINQCLSFYSYRIESESIQIRQDYSLMKTSFSSDKDSFYQLLLNLFHQSLERTPERGSLLVLPPYNRSSFSFVVSEGAYLVL